MSRVLFIGLDQEETLRQIEAAIDRGVPEIHVGWSRCGFCGVEIGDVEDTQLVHYQANPTTVINLHLCPECHNDWQKHTKRRAY